MHRLTPERLARVDRQGMRRLLADLPRHMEEAWGLVPQPPLKMEASDLRAVVIVGMGGSAIRGEIAAEALERAWPWPIWVVREPTLPGWVNGQTLAVMVSYSGETEEVLAGYRQARARRSRVLVVTSGGRLKAWALEAGDPLVSLPPGFPPRAAIAYLTLPLLRVLHQFRALPGVTDSALSPSGGLRRLSHRLDQLDEANPALALARRLSHRFPIIYTAKPYGGVATRWRTQLAENGKTVSFSSLLPEMLHNEIEAWTGRHRELKVLFPIFLEGADLPPGAASLLRQVKQVLSRRGMDQVSVRAQGRGLWERIFSLILWGDYLSFFVAMTQGVDPTPVATIQRLKRERTTV